jgi:hypothetical protein
VLCDTKGLRDHFFLLRKPTGTNSEGDLIIIRSEKIIGSIESELVLQGKLHDSSRNHLSLFIHRRTTGKGSRSERERDFHDSHNCAYKEGRTQVDERKQKLEETEVEVESAVVGERSF